MSGNGNVRAQGPGQRVGESLDGKWRLERLLGAGGMGAVYEGMHRNGRRAAIKILHARYAKDENVRRRFLREGYVANKIDHPGALAILDDDVAADGSPFLVLELLEGESLSDRLQRAGGRLPAAETLAIAGQLLGVLGAAHEQGIVHRDVKPANVFVTTAGHVKLLDFGLARVRDGASSLLPTAEGAVLGTHGYMSPEQARGQQDKVDARSDLFSVGAVLFRAISGTRIHEKAIPFDMIVAAARDPAPPLASALPDAGPALAAAVDRALAFDPERRWQTAREMFEGLRLAYEELTRDPSVVARRSQVPAGDSIDVSIAWEDDTKSSAIVDVAFGANRDQALARERMRTREIIEGLSGISVVVDPETTLQDRGR